MTNKYGSARKANPQRGPGCGCLSIALIIILLALAIASAIWYNWAHSAMSNYQDLNSGSKIAQVCASKTRAPNEMSVQVTTFDKNGNPTSNPPQTIKGDILLLRGDIIKYPDPLPAVGLSSGYKLTRLEGHYGGPKNENQYGSIVTINGDDPFFTKMHDLSTPVEANYSTSNPISVDGKTYDIFLTPTGVIQASIALGQPGCGPHAKAAH